MLYIDGLMMKHLKDELNSALAGRKTGKIYQYDNFSIAFMFGKVNLSISINPELPIVYLSQNLAIANFHLYYSAKRLYIDTPLYSFLPKILLRVLSFSPRLLSLITFFYNGPYSYCHILDFWQQELFILSFSLQFYNINCLRVKFYFFLQTYIL